MGLPWLEPADLPGARTHASELLRYSVRVPGEWGDGEERELPTHREELIRGIATGEGLLVQFMEDADPEADLRGWARAPLHIAGAPAVSLALGDAPETLEWRPVEAPASLADRLRADEVHLFEGSVYTVLARRGTLAWHVGLATPSPELAGGVLSALELE